MSKTKTYFLIFFAFYFLGTFFIEAQTPNSTPIQKPILFSGILVDSLNNRLAYAGIGILGKGLGTISDSLGRFSLEIPEGDLKDSLRITCIGYKTLLIRLEILPRPWDKLKLVIPSLSIPLNELSVSANPGLEEKVGRTSEGKLIQFSIFGKNQKKSVVGAELGLEFQAKRHPAWLKDLNFYITGNSFSHIKFRILLYAIHKHEPDSVLIQKPLFFSVENQKTGWIHVDLSREGIILDQDCFISLQWVENSPIEIGKQPAFLIPAALSFSHYLFSRGASEDHWIKVKANTSLYITLMD